VLADRFDPRVVATLMGHWPKVVHIIATGTDKKSGLRSDWTGTGFLIQSPSRTYLDSEGTNRMIKPKVKSLVLTNRHVYNDNVAKNINLMARFEADGKEEDFPLSLERVFESKLALPDKGKLVPQQELNRLDFVALRFKLPGLPQLQLNRLVRLTNEFISWEESARVYNVPKGTPVVIIGHPKGLSKRGSISTLGSDFAMKGCFMAYDSQHAYFGNSGSPVFAILPNYQLDGSTACALHFATGTGVTFVGGIAEQLRKQYAALPPLTREQCSEHLKSGAYDIV